MRRKLIWYSILGGVFLTLLAIVLRFAGIYWPVPYLTYAGAYLMQTFLSEIPRMDSMEVCGQSDLRTTFILRVECFGLRFRDFFFCSGSFSRIAHLNCLP